MWCDITEELYATISMSRSINSTAARHSILIDHKCRPLTHVTVAVASCICLCLSCKLRRLRARRGTRSDRSPSLDCCTSQMQLPEPWFVPSACQEPGVTELATELGAPQCSSSYATPTPLRPSSREGTPGEHEPAGQSDDVAPNALATRAVAAEAGPGSEKQQTGWRPYARMIDSPAVPPRGAVKPTRCHISGLAWGVAGITAVCLLAHDAYCAGWFGLELSKYLI